MRLTPAQLGVELICGNPLPTRPDRALVECLVEGRAMLVSVAGIDFGYDLQKWHDHLKVSRQGGDTWNRTIVLPKVMQAALASETWRQAVREAEATHAPPHVSRRAAAATSTSAPHS